MQITVDQSRIITVPIDELRPNTWNPKDRDTKEFNDVKASISANGLKTFIVVRENKDDISPYEIIDGEQKWRACKSLGFDKVIIYNEGGVEDKRARELTLWWQVQVPFNEMTLAKLIHSMLQDFGQINSAFTQDQIDEFKAISKVSEGFKDLPITPPAMMESEMRTFQVQLTQEQYNNLQLALKKIREAGDNTMTDTRAFEFLCVEYINSGE